MTCEHVLCRKSREDIIKSDTPIRTRLWPPINCRQEGPYMRPLCAFLSSRCDMESILDVDRHFTLAPVISVCTAPSHPTTDMMIDARRSINYQLVFFSASKATQNGVWSCLWMIWVSTWRASISVDAASIRGLVHTLVYWSVIMLPVTAVIPLC